MSNLQKEDLEKVVGGEITNNSSLEEKQEELKELKGILAQFQEQQNNAKSIQESMELLDKITTLMRQILELENEISKAK